MAAHMDLYIDAYMQRAATAEESECRRFFVSAGGRLYCRIYIDIHWIFTGSHEMSRYLHRISLYHPRVVSQTVFASWHCAVCAMPTGVTHHLCIGDFGEECLLCHRTYHQYCILRNCISITILFWATLAVTNRFNQDKPPCKSS